MPLTKDDLVKQLKERGQSDAEGDVNWRRWFLSLKPDERRAYRQTILSLNLDGVRESSVLMMFYTYDYLSLESTEEELREAHRRYYNLQQFRWETSGIDEEFTEGFDAQIDEAEHEMFERYRRAVGKILEGKA